jgi:hypothetical protein
LACTNIPNVGVAPELTVVATVLVGIDKQVPVTGLVSQIKIFTGIFAPPVSADAVMVALAPTFTVATAKAPAPPAPGTFKTPSLLVVAAKATMSGTGELEAEKSKVLSPGRIEAGLLFAQSKSNCTSVGDTGALGVNAKTYV